MNIAVFSADDDVSVITITDVEASHTRCFRITAARINPVFKGKHDRLHRVIEQTTVYPTRRYVVNSALSETLVRARNGLL